jgi:hypothetical protein
MSADLTGYSSTELAQAAQAVEAEVRRREAQDEAARAEQFATELAEVKAGTRRVDTEHLAHLTPAQTLEAVNRGQARHLGIAPDRRLSRGR